MFKPQLGVSLHTITVPLTSEHAGILRGTSVKTLEVLPSSLFDAARPQQSKAVLKQMLARPDLRLATVHCPFGGGLDISSPEDAVRSAGQAVLGEAIALAEEFRAPMVVVHASAEPIAAGERWARLDRAGDSLAQVADRCASASIRIAVELLPRTCLGNTVEELIELLRGLPSASFGVCLDVNHLMDRYAELPDTVVALGSRLFTLHLSDYDGVDEKHWMPGEGVIDWAGFMQALTAIDYAGPFNYEAKPHGNTPAEKLADLEANFGRLCRLLSG